MICRDLQPRLKPGILDEGNSTDRQRIVAHLRCCRSCREHAAAVDPTIVFSIQSSPQVSSDEIEQVRHTVQAMRRVRELEASWTRTARYGVAAGALAALLLAVILLVPFPARETGSQEVPFAGAVGVGSGLVRLPAAAKSSRRVELRFELASSPRVERLAEVRELSRQIDTVVQAETGVAVDHDMSRGYRVQFRVAPGPSEGVVLLEELRLASAGGAAAEPLLGGALRVARDEPLILGLPAAETEHEQLWLRVTYTKNAEESR